MDRNRIECSKPDDRDMLVMILARNGYTARQVKGFISEDRRYTYFVEYWKDDNQ